MAGTSQAIRAKNQEGCQVLRSRFGLPTCLAVALLCSPTFAQVLLRSHEFDVPLGNTGAHTMIKIGDVGTPNETAGDAQPDGFADYAVINDKQEEVWVFNGRFEGPPIIKPLPCLVLPGSYGGFGACGDGGKDIVASGPVPDGIPDFVVGAPECRFIAPNIRGQIYVFNGDTLESTVYYLPDSEMTLRFGRAVDVMRDYTGDGFAEILVGSDSNPFEPSAQCCAGEGYVIDVHDPTGALFEIPPPTDGQAARFSSTVAYMADILRDDGTEFGSEDMLTRADEVVIGDGHYDANGTGTSGFEHGLVALLYGKNNFWYRTTNIVNGYQFGTVSQGHLGYQVRCLGDVDNGRPTSPPPEPLETYRSWDVGFAHGQLQATIKPSGLIGTNTFLTPYGPEFPVATLFPSLDRTFGDNRDTYPSELSPVGDINLDGYDDFAVVVKVGPTLSSHAVRIYSGVPPAPGLQPTMLWELSTYPDVA